MSVDTTSSVEVVTSRERLSGVVQAVGRRPGDIERRWWESAAIFAVFAVFYSLVGIYLIRQDHVVGFDVLDRFNRADMIWHNAPPKLSAVGFDYPPLTVILLTPLTIVTALLRTLVVLPIVTALFAGYAMVTVNRMMRRSAILLPLRLAVLATLGLNPLVVMYASLGQRNFMWLGLVVIALGALFAWYVTADIRFIMVAGLAFAVAAVTGYGSLLYFLVSAIMIAAILARLGADGTEVEGTAVGFASPTVYVITLWTAFNLILLLKPFDWLTHSSDSSSSGGLGSFSFYDIVRDTGSLVFYGAPIAIIVLPALIFAGIARRNGFALWLGVLLLVSILAPGLAVLVRVTDSPMLMSNALPILFLSVVGAIWLARSAAAGSTLVAGILAVALLLSIPWTFHAMRDFKHQGIERAFHDAVAGDGSQEGAVMPDGSVVGYGNERDMGDWIRDHIHDQNAVLTDNAVTYGVMFFTADPALYFDRVDQSDGPWRRAATDPADHVTYMLLSRDTSRDLLSRLYPAAAAGMDPLLQPVHYNDRYVLVRVPRGFTYATDQARTAGFTSGSGTSGGATSGLTGLSGSTGTGTGTSDQTQSGPPGGVDGVAPQGSTTSSSSTGSTTTSSGTGSTSEPSQAPSTAVVVPSPAAGSDG